VILKTYTVTLAVANQVEILVLPVKGDTDVSITCGFGMATVEIGTRENAEAAAWAALPAVGEYDKKLADGEALYVRANIAPVRVPVVLGRS